MPILLKPNSRIQLTSCHKWGFTFTVDGKKTVNFYAEDPSVQSSILNFMHHGGTKNGVITDLSTDYQRSKMNKFINSLEVNSLIDNHFHFAPPNLVAIETPVSRYTILLKNEDFTKGPYALSRFAYFCIENGSIVCKSPLGRFEFTFSPDLFTRLFPILTSKDGLRIILDIFPEHLTDIATLIQLLIENRILQTIDFEEDECLKTWEFIIMTQYNMNLSN